MRNALLLKASGMDDRPFYMFAEIGMVLCNLQTVEEMLRLLCGATRVESTGEKTANVFDKLEKGTLGRLITEIGKHTDIDSSFSDELDELLELRNKFVHNAFVRAEFQFLDGREQEREASGLLGRLGYLTGRVHKVLSSYIIAGLTEHFDVLDLDEMAEGLTSSGVTVEEARQYFASLCECTDDPLNLGSIWSYEHKPPRAQQGDDAN